MTKKTLTIIFVFICIVLIIMKRPNLIWDARFVVEDGSKFFKGAYENGLQSLWTPHAGYLHLLLRIIALSTISIPVIYLPTIYALFWAGITILVLFLFAKSVREYFALSDTSLWPYIIALVPLLIPNNGEIYLHITNLQWITGMLLVLWLWQPPKQNIILISTGTVVLGLTGPFSLLLFPVYGLKTVFDSENKFRYLCLSSILTITGLIQLGFMSGNRTGPINIGILTLFVNLARIITNIYIPYSITSNLEHLYPPIHYPLAFACFLVFLWSIVLLMKLSNLRFPLLGAFLILLAGIVAMQDRIDKLDVFIVSRYLFIPLAIYVLALIYALYEGKKHRKCPRLIQVLLFAIGFNSLWNYTVLYDQPVNWKNEARTLESGQTVKLPVQGSRQGSPWLVEIKGKK